MGDGLKMLIVTNSKYPKSFPYVYYGSKDDKHASPVFWNEKMCKLHDAVQHYSNCNWESLEETSYISSNELLKFWKDEPSLGMKKMEMIEVIKDFFSNEYKIIDSNDVEGDKFNDKS